FFFKQKTAYEISRDWSSDVCSSDLSLATKGLTFTDTPGSKPVTQSIAPAEALPRPNRFNGWQPCTRPGLTTSMRQRITPSASRRSEERRVGKEGISQRDAM